MYTHKFILYVCGIYQTDFLTSDYDLNKWSPSCKNLQAANFILTGYFVSTTLATGHISLENKRLITQEV